MTDRQWKTLKEMTSSSIFKGTTWWACDLEIGRVTVNRLDDHYELSYPSYSVNLYKDEPINPFDLTYLRTLYNEWSSYMKRRDL